MNGLRRWASAAGGAAILLGMISGCQTTPRRTASAEPGMSSSPTLGGPIEPGTSKVAAATGETWVDRHPLFWKPKHYYESTESNKAVKVGVATVVGVPAGLFGELKQIVTGAPAGAKY